MREFSTSLPDRLAAGVHLVETSHAQPIFYPVLNEAYATKIARDWNTRDAASGYAGYVTRFSVRSDYLERYDVQTVGDADLHREYWIPAEALDEFNSNILGKIEVIAKFRGDANG